MNYLNLAAKIACADITVKASHRKNYFLGAVCIRADGAIVVAKNLLIKSPTGTAHAEYRALRKGGYGSTLYVARVTRDGCRANAKPCSLCEAFIYNKHVKKVYYTISDNEFGVINI